MTNQDRANVLAGEGFEDFTPEALAALLVYAEKVAYGMAVTPEAFRARILKERARLASVAALPSKAKADPAAPFEYTAAMYGSARMTNTDDQPDGYMGD